MRTLFLFIAAMLLCCAPAALADSPDNMNIVWGRVARDNTPIYAEMSTASLVMSRYPSKYCLNIASLRDSDDGTKWFEVVWPFKGWLRAEDAWFADGSYNPAGMKMAQRLSLRLATDLGNCPENSETLLGKAATANTGMRQDSGSDMICQTLTWPGLVISYETSREDKKMAWITKASASAGSHVSFGPVRVGNAADRLKLLDPAFDGQTDGDFDMDDGPFHFRFTLREGRIESMVYIYGSSPDFLPPPSENNVQESALEPDASAPALHKAGEGLSPNRTAWLRQNGLDPLLRDSAASNPAQGKVTGEASKTASALPSTGTFDVSDLRVKGRVVKNFRYTDATGDNVILLTEMPKQNRIVDQYGTTLSSKELYAWRFQIGPDGTTERVWRITDYMRDCETDLTATFLSDAFQTTDLDGDGTREIWVPYVLGCRGDVGPLDMKLIMYEGGKKHAMRGTTRVQIAPDKFAGGSYKMDAAFADAPAAFRSFAKKFWQQHISGR